MILSSVFRFLRSPNITHGQPLPQHSLTSRTHQGLDHAAAQLEERLSGTQGYNTRGTGAKRVAERCFGGLLHILFSCVLCALLNMFV